MKVNLAVWSLSNPHNSENIACINYDMFTRESGTRAVISTLMSQIEGLPKVAGNHWKNDSVAKIVQDSDVITTDQC